MEITYLKEADHIHINKSEKYLFEYDCEWGGTGA